MQIHIAGCLPVLAIEREQYLQRPWPYSATMQCILAHDTRNNAEFSSSNAGFNGKDRDRDNDRTRRDGIGSGGDKLHRSRGMVLDTY